MKKILFIHQAGGWGGGGVSFIDIVTAIMKNYEIVVCCPVKPKVVYDLLIKLGIRVIVPETDIALFSCYNGGTKNAIRLHALKSYYKMTRTAKYVEQLIIREKPDYLAVNSMTLAYLGKQAKKHGVPSICFNRESYAKGLFGLRTKIIKAQQARFFNKVVYISQHDKNVSKPIMGEGHVIYDKVHIDNYNILDKSKLRKEQNLSQDNFYVLYLGGLNKLKGAYVILKAFKHIKNKNIKLIFVNNKNLSLDKLYSRKSIKNLIKYHSILGYEYKCVKIFKYLLSNNSILQFPTAIDVEKYIVASDVLVFPSTLPHQARPVYEAGAAKIPVIITDSDNIKEFVSNEVNGFVFENKNSKELAGLIERLYKEQSLVEKMGNNNYIKTIENHNYKNLTSELKKIFN